MGNLGAIVLAAGLGKRMKSVIPKVLHPLGGVPILTYPLRAAKRLCPKRIAVVVGHRADEVKKVFPERGVQWVYQEEPRGTGDAVLRSRKAFRGFSGDVLILSGDVPLISQQTLEALLAFHRREGSVVTLLTAQLEQPRGYGRILRGKNGEIIGVVEESDASEEEKRTGEINTGTYVVSSAFLFPALENLNNSNRQGEYYLPDIVRNAVHSGKKIGGISVEDPRETLGINTREELAVMEKMLRERINRKWMDAGVTLMDPATTYIEEGVAIGGDTVIGPNTQLRGRTVIGRRCRIDGNAYVTDATLADNVHLKFSVVLDRCKIEEGAEVGPFAHLRLGAVLKRNVHVGSFVEVKNSVLGEGTKSNHLAYIGDATVGRDCNIGAGTITCNYDGFEKYKTQIGNRVQVGSNTQLVAPVSVGDDAYVGAGSTITKDVPPGSLALSRVPQTHVEGWVDRFRARKGKRQK